jgi:hypothetical protein
VRALRALVRLLPHQAYLSLDRLSGRHGHRGPCSSRKDLRRLLAGRALYGGRARSSSSEIIDHLHRVAGPRAAQAARTSAQRAEQLEAARLQRCQFEAPESALARIERNGAVTGDRASLRG